MRIQLLISVIAFSLLLSCDQIIGTGDASDSFSIMPDEVSILDKSNNSVTFSFTNTCSSGCWKNVRPSVQKKSQNFSIKMVAEKSQNPCLAVCGLLEREIKIDIKKPGTYDFSFIHRDSTYHNFNLIFP